MIRVYKLFLFSLATIIFLIITLCVKTVAIVLPINPLRILTIISTYWGKAMVWILNISVLLKGEYRNYQNSQYLIVSNHQSYLDVIIIASIIPTLFVAKKDVQSWPIFGWLASLGGTLYIDRNKFRGAINSIEEIEKSLLNHISVNVFPEGTSSNGEAIFPFRPTLFSAALAAKSAVLPLSINYNKINSIIVDKSNRDIICWYGDMTFTNHFWELLGADSIEVSIFVHPFISAIEFQNPKELSTAAYNVINNGFNRFI
jgi:1-acyl-sn-glycerol-3-phosphate acyltransferase